MTSWVTDPRGPLPRRGSGTDAWRHPALPACDARPLRAAAGPVLLVGLLGLTAWRIDVGALTSALAACAVPTVVLATLLHAASGVAKAMTWQALVAGLPSADGRSRPADLVSPLMVGALVDRSGWRAPATSPSSAWPGGGRGREGRTCR